MQVRKQWVTVLQVVMVAGFSFALGSYTESFTGRRTLEWVLVFGYGILLLITMFVVISKILRNE